MKRIIFSSVALVFCALMIFGAIMQLRSDRVECGGETMLQGDVCVSKSRSGRVTESTLEETKTSGKVGAIAGIVIGALGILIAAQNLKIGIKNRKAASASGGPGSDMPSPLQQFAAYPPGPQDFAQPGFPQQNQYPPHPQDPSQGFPQYTPPQQYAPQQAMPPRYAPHQPQQEYPQQQHYYQPPQHQYHQPPGPGDAQR